MQPSNPQSENFGATDHKTLPNLDEQMAAFVGPLAEPKPVNFVAAIVVDGDVHVHGYQAIAAGPPIRGVPFKRVITETGRWVMHPDIAAGLVATIAGTLAPTVSADLAKSIMADAEKRGAARSSAN